MPAAHNIACMQESRRVNGAVMRFTREQGLKKVLKCLMRENRNEVFRSEYNLHFKLLYSDRCSTGIIPSICYLLQDFIPLAENCQTIFFLFARRESMLNTPEPFAAMNKNKKQ